MNASELVSELWHCLPRLRSEAAQPQAIISSHMYDAVGLLYCGLELRRLS
jgi:hypothetical protein